MKHTITLLLLLLCSACIQLGGEPAQTRYYLLEATDDSAPSGPPCQVRLAFAPIDFPGYLDRLQLVSRAPNNGILLAELDRWAEPLSDNLQRTLQENLRRQLPGLDNSPTGKDNCGYRLKLQVNRFDGRLGHQLDVDIRWTLLVAGNGSVVASEQYLDQRPIDRGYQQLVNGLNAALAGLSEQISTALLEQQCAQ